MPTTTFSFIYLNPAGDIKDLEEMNITRKIHVLRSHEEWKCMNKNEVLDEHALTWRSNGLSNLQYELLSIEMKNECTDVYTVDVRLNGHWTDTVCGVDDKQ